VMAEAPCTAPRRPPLAPGKRHLQAVQRVARS
jgi:hypothetical protein